MGYHSLGLRSLKLLQLNSFPFADYESVDKLFFIGRGTCPVLDLCLSVYLAWLALQRVDENFVNGHLRHRLMLPTSAF